MTDTWEIRSRFGVENPERVRMSLKMTAQLRDWEELLDQLDSMADKNKSLAYEMRRQIRALVNQARKEFIVEPKAAS